jgi:hypothetical protein
MNDLIIRRSLLRRLADDFAGDPSLIVSEFDLCQGRVRADVVVVNGHLHGYEIKSAVDSLGRLPIQVEAYNKVLDYLTIVTCPNHLAGVRAQVPRWWGILVVQSRNGVLHWREVRTARLNACVERYALAQLLWRQEALALLTEFGVDRGVKSSPRRVLWQALARQLDRQLLNQCVRDRIKLRQGWRADALRT